MGRLTAEAGDPDRPFERAPFCRLMGIAFLISALAGATFIVMSALVDWLDGMFA